MHKRLGLLPLLLVACATVRRPPSSTQSNSVFAVLISGGGQREANYQSHLTHLQRLVDLLQKGGVEKSRISVFASDGGDPEPDLAVRTVQDDPRSWLLPRRSPLDPLRPPLEFVNSTLKGGFNLRPARKEALRQWFAEQGRRLTAHDTLLLYVTDHGARNEQDLTNNSIVLWNESLNVSELRQWLTLLNPEVRVVMVMAQCFSGAFAGLIYPAGTQSPPRGNLCGYFAAPPDRRASGCYPENRGKSGVGYSHELFQGLEVFGELSSAHRWAQVADMTPDVPFATTDVYLAELLRQAAERYEAEPDAYADTLLPQAWKEPQRWAPDLRLLDGTAKTYGLPSPRSFQEAGEASRVAEALQDEAETDAQYWGDGLEALLKENARVFLDSHPVWYERLGVAAEGLSPVERQALRSQLLGELDSYTRAYATRLQLLQSAREKATDAAGVASRAEIRNAALLRMRGFLTRIAGRFSLAHQPSPEHQALNALRSCEALHLGAGTQRPGDAEPPFPAPFPTLMADREQLGRLKPSWSGIRYQAVPEELRAQDLLPRGSVVVAGVFPDSAAGKAGLQVGDLILGTDEESFDESQAMRLWAMQSRAGVPTGLKVKRGRKELILSLTPGAYPTRPPELPGPPRVGSLAPPLHVEPFRGGEPKLEKKPRLLFFWSTSCVTCVQALPELLAFSRTRDVPVVVITSERRETLESFFERFKKPFPSIVAVDPLRLTFEGYGVKDVPTFVLVDETDRIRAFQSGYSPSEGLRIEGWEAAPASVIASSGGWSAAPD